MLSLFLRFVHRSSPLWHASGRHLFARRFQLCFFAESRASRFPAIFPSRLPTVGSGNMARNMVVCLALFPLFSCLLCVLVSLFFLCAVLFPRGHWCVVTPLCTFSFHNPSSSSDAMGCRGSSVPSRVPTNKQKTYPNTIRFCFEGMVPP